MVIVISALAGIAVFLLLKATIAKPEGIGIHEEYKKATPGKSKEKRNLLIGCLFCAIAGYAVTGRLLFTVAAIPGGFFIARWLLNRQKLRKTELLQTQYLQVLNNLIASMQGGASPYQAFEDTVPGLPQPSRDIFIEIVRRSRTGSTYSEALASVAQESGWKDLESLQMALSLYDSTGCNLVEVLKHLLKSTYESNSDRKYVEATTSSIRATCSLLSFLPFILMALARMMAPEFTAPLFDTTGGIIVVCMVVVMVLMGNVVTKRMLQKSMGS